MAWFHKVNQSYDGDYSEMQFDELGFNTALKEVTKLKIAGQQVWKLPSTTVNLCFI